MVPPLQVEPRPEGERLQVVIQRNPNGDQPLQPPPLLLGQVQDTLNFWVKFSE